MARFLRIKEWETYQHYKDRNPAWIKLHKRLLDDFDFHQLPVASKALAPMLWLLASESRDVKDGLIDMNYGKIAFRLRTTATAIEDAVKPLIQHGFVTVIDDASNSLAEPEQEASPEKRREETYKPEKEGEEEIQNPPEGIHALGYARGICDQLGLPCKGNLEVIADSITAVARLHELSPKGSYIFLLGHAKDSLARGEAVDRWWFQDAKWRNRNGKQPDSKAVQRARNNAAAIRAGLGIGGNADDVLPTSGEGFASRGDEAMGSDVRTGEPGEIEMGIPRAPKNVKFLSKAGGHY